MSKFKEVKVVDNFYQNSLFFPMPTVAISTLAEDGTTTIGAYSLSVSLLYSWKRLLCDVA